MTDWLYIASAGSVGLFGAILSASFCDIVWTRRYKLAFLAALVLLGALQALAYGVLGIPGLRAWYPAITHLPLVVALAVLSRKKLWSAIAVLTAYLCCQLRRWLALFCVELFSGGESMQAAVELAVTVPLLLLILRFASPAVRGMSRQPAPMQLQFGLIPVVGYLFDYLTRIYTDWLIRGVPAAVEFMPFVCSAAYLVFVLHSSRSLRRQSELEQTRAVLDLQVKQAARQIAGMKRSQELAAEYRHDLRHHLQYLSSCIETDALDQARTYIRSLNAEITGQAVTQYCGNTAANLVLSSYAARAAEAGIPMDIRVQLGEFPRLSDNDLCVLLSNALENALHAGAGVKAAGGEPALEVRGYEKGGRFFLEVANSCGEAVEFVDELPVTREKGHGIGVRSICAVVEKYGGVHHFEVRDGRFLLRLTL